MKARSLVWASLVGACLLAGGGTAAAAPFKIFMVASTAPDHLMSTAMARTALATMGQANNFTVDFTDDPTLINDANLAKYDVFLQMHLAPFEINLDQRLALEHFVKQGKGWVGIHGAGLIIPSSYEKRMYPNWDFYSQLLGGIVYVVHPALQNGTVIVEDRTHPATKNLPAMFQIRDEWYEWDKNPRPAANIRVLARADEKSYSQVKPQGDHPIIWACEAFPRAIYIGVGHDATDWNNATYTTMIRDALVWASTRDVAPAADGGVDAGATDVAADSGSGSGSGGATSATGGASGSGGATSGTGGASGSGGVTGSGGAPSQTSGGSSGCTVAPATPIPAGACVAFLAFLAFLALALRRRRRR